jgi:hypothetical protein
MDKNAARTRRLAFLLSGLMDCILGAVLILVRLNLLSINLSQLGIPLSWVGLIGAVMAASGVIVVVYQLTRLMEPDE